MDNRIETEGLHQRTITCVVCGAVHEARTAMASGWRLAANRIGGYTCGTVCDDRVTAADAELKAYRDKLKADKKKENRGHPKLL